MDKLQILNQMAGLQAIAENENTGLEDFLPLRSYEILGDPNKFLILGGRGTGKTKLFKTLLKKEGFGKIIGEEIRLFKPNAFNSEFIAGFREGSDFPSQSVMSKNVNDKNAAAFWAGSVVILLLNYYKGNQDVMALAGIYFTEEIYECMSSLKSLKSPSLWMPYIIEEPELWENFLDDVNEYAETHDRWVFLAYDSLDRICEKYMDLFFYIRTLLSFWYTHSRRWSRIKCKIFLRNDLYDSEMLIFPDASKMGSNCLRLEWNTLSLYRLLVKKMANLKDEETIAYLRLTKKLISDTPDENLGYIPTEREDIMREFVDKMIGKYMGNNAKKGLSYPWAPNHLQDTHGVLAPRSFVKCYSVAARKMCERTEDVEKLPEIRLLSPSMLQGAVQEVSEDRVKELQEEYPWLEKMKRAFSGITLLMEKNEFIQKISMDLWNEKDRRRLPASSPQGIFDTLEKLGIVFVAKDGRVNVPEIYLHGFGMKRKGGLRRPN